MSIALTLLPLVGAGEAPEPPPDPPAEVTWDAAVSSASLTIYDGGYSVQATGGSWYSATTETDPSTDKFYCEFVVNDSAHSGGSDSALTIGYAPPSTDLTSGSTFLGNATDTGAYIAGDTVREQGESDTSFGVTFSSGDIVGMAIDRTTGEGWIAVNGTWVNSGDPAAGTGPVFVVVPASARVALSARVRNSKTGDVTRRTKNSEFSYSVPSGFKGYAEPV